MNTVSIAEVLSRRVALEPHEVVAMVQQLIHQPQDERVPATQPFGPPSPENIVIRADGSVVCTGCDATPSTAEAAVLLQKLLAATPRVPGGLQSAIGRALQDVTGPPFDSLDDFSSALARHEQGDRQAVVRGLFERSLLEPTSSAAASFPSPDRRAHPPIVAELRRQLREADRSLFEKQATPGSPSTGGKFWSRGVGVPAIAAGVVGAFVIILAAETMHLYRQNTAAAPRTMAAAPARGNAPAPAPTNTAAPAPVSTVVPTSTNAAAPASTNIAPVARDTRADTPPQSVRVAAKRVVSARTPNTARAKRAAQVRKVQKPKHRKFLGLRFFSG
jgi:hypothetical protein